MKRRPKNSNPPSPAPTKPHKRDDRFTVLAICALLAATIWIAFGGALGNDFVNFDDGPYVYANPEVNHGLTPTGVLHAFTQTHADNWHPLTWLSHMLDCQVYGLKPAGHHATSVLIHTANAILLFLILRRLTNALWRSALVAAIFALHPLRVESVAWVAERKDVLSGLFFLLTIAAYLRYARRPSIPRYFLVAGLFVLGLMCKPMLVTLPLVLLLLDYWPLNRWQNSTPLRLIAEKLPLLALSAVSCIITFLAQTGAIKPFDQVPLTLRLLNALTSCAVYIGQMFWPSGLAVLYPFPSSGLPAWQIILAATSILGATAIAFVLRRRQPYLLAGWLWYFVMLVPVIGFFQVGAQAHADRYTYLPSIGLTLALVWLVADACVGNRLWRTAATVCSVVILAALIVSTRTQTTYWRNSQTLWTHALRATTGNFIAYNNLGTAFYEKGEIENAITEYEAAVALRPDYEEAHFNLGTALIQKNNPDDAIAEFQAALRLDPNHAQAHINLATALVQMGDPASAIAHLQTALKIDPTNIEANHNLAWIESHQSLQETNH